MTATAMKTPTVAAYCFSRQAVPAGKEFAPLRKALAHGFMRAEFEPHPAGGFSATLQTLPGVSILTGFCTGGVVRCASSSDGDDGFIFGMLAAGTGFVSQSDREMMVAAGEGFLLSCAEGGTLAFPGKARFICLHLPRHTLPDHLVATDAALLKTVPKNTGALEMLREYLSEINGSRSLLGTRPELEAGRAVAAHMQYLVALALDAPRDNPEQATPRSLPGERLQAIKKDIANLLGRADLSVGLIADRHGVSPRYIQKLFEAKGTKFSEFVLDRRLALAHRRLSDAAHAGRTITDIALEVGFSDLSYFNRRFRRRYGVVPSSLRPAGQHGAQSDRGA